MRRFVLWGSLSMAAWVVIAGEHGLLGYMSLKNKQTDLTQKTRQLTAQISDLEQEIWRLQHDTLYIEKLARERLGFARPDERVFMITQH